MTETGNPNSANDSDEDSAVRAESAYNNMDSTIREPLPGLAGLGVPSPAQSSKPGSDTAETASIPPPTVEDVVDSSRELDTRIHDDAIIIDGTAFRNTVERPVWPSDRCGDCRHDEMMSSIAHRLENWHLEPTCPAHPDHLPNYRMQRKDALMNVPCGCGGCHASRKQASSTQGPRPQMRVQALRIGARDFDLRVHWEDEEAGSGREPGEAIVTPASSGPSLIRTASHPNSRIGAIRADAPNQVIETTGNAEEPAQESESKVEEDEEINPHSLPEIHHQQQRRAARAAPAAGPQTRADQSGDLFNCDGGYPSGGFHSSFGLGGPTPIFASPYSMQMVGPYQQPFAAQPLTAQHMGNQPYLVMNPPVVPPAVQATVPGTASWCYPNYRQSSFHSGTAHWRTNPPIIVGQPGGQQPTLINGQTHNIIYYR